MRKLFGYPAVSLAQSIILIYKQILSASFIWLEFNGNKIGKVQIISNNKKLNYINIFEAI